jgi:hypothetical protein
MEMKADIAGKPVDSQFHKIYIQRYENVRCVTLFGPVKRARILKASSPIFKLKGPKMSEPES